MKIRKFFVLFATLVIALVGVTAVGAQDDNQPGPRNGRPIRHAFQTVIDIVTQTTGLNRAEIITQMSEGNTLADVITTSGNDPQAVIDQSVAQLTEDINQAVANGRLTQERADRLLGNLEDVVTRGINGEFRQRAIEARVRIGVLRLASQETGLNPREIVQEIRSGKSLGQVLTENGVDTAAFIETAVSTLQERLNQAVTNGRLTQEQADQRVTEFRDRLTERLNQDGAPLEPTSLPA